MELLNQYYPGTYNKGFMDLLESIYNKGHDLDIIDYLVGDNQ